MQRAHALASHVFWLSQRHRKHGFVPLRIMCPAFLATRDACVEKSRIYTSQGKAQGEKNTGCGEVRRGEPIIQTLHPLPNWPGTEQKAQRTEDGPQPSGLFQYPG